MGRVRITIGQHSEFLKQADELGIAAHGDSGQFPLNKWKELWKSNPESFLFAVDVPNNRLVGYIICCPLPLPEFDTTILPDYDESNFDPKKVLPYRDGANFIYIFGIVIDHRYENRITTLKEMAIAQKAFFADLAKEGKYVVEASACAFTDSGEKLCWGLNMDRVGVNNSGSVFYNKEFYKLYKNEDVRDHILRNFIRNKAINNKIKDIPA